MDARIEIIKHRVYEPSLEYVQKEMRCTLQHYQHELPFPNGLTSRIVNVTEFGPITHYRFPMINWWGGIQIDFPNQNIQSRILLEPCVMSWQSLCMSYPNAVDKALRLDAYGVVDFCIKLITIRPADKQESVLNAPVFRGLSASAPLQDFADKFGGEHKIGICGFVLLNVIEMMK